MQSTKSLARVANDSELCKTFMNKHLFVLISLLQEPQGLRVSDIHRILEGNKSWICNILLKLEKLDLTTRIKYDDKREVYYKLTERGEQVATNGLNLTYDLLEHEGFKILWEYNPVYLIFGSDLEKQEFSNKIIRYRSKIKHLPLHKYVGKLTIYDNYLTIIGKDPFLKKFFFFKLDYDNVLDIIFDYDNQYKGRYGSILSKPVRIDFSRLNSKSDSIYLFIEWSRSFKTAKKNKEFYEKLKEILNGE
ncbi:MAG: winged helix DNA-binding protein [Candidatus Helarchaeota archaeon]